MLPPKDLAFEQAAGLAEGCANVAAPRAAGSAPNARPGVGSTAGSKRTVSDRPTIVATESATARGTRGAADGTNPVAPSARRYVDRSTPSARSTASAGAVACTAMLVTDVCVSPCPCSQSVTCWMSAGLGPKRRANSPVGSHRPYCGDAASYCSRSSWSSSSSCVGRRITVMPTGRLGAIGPISVAPAGTCGARRDSRTRPAPDSAAGAGAAIAGTRRSAARAIPCLRLIRHRSSPRTHT